MLTMTIHGRIGRDAEVRYTDSGTAVLGLAVACNYGRKGEDGKKPTQWIKATMWGNQAESLEQYLTKGKGVSITLRDVHVKTFNKNDGTTGYSLEGDVADFEFTGAGPRQEGEEPRRAAPAAAAPAKAASKPSSEDWDDDIPF